MSKRIIKKYHLKDNVLAAIYIIITFTVIMSALFYQAGKVEEEKQQHESNTIISVHQTR